MRAGPRPRREPDRAPRTRRRHTSRERAEPDVDRFTLDETSCVARAGDDPTYFDLDAAGWDEAKLRQGRGDQDMFTLHNVPFLNDAIAAKRPMDFSHDPEHGRGALGGELEHLLEAGYRCDRKELTAEWAP